jgi:hypothetical protein
VNPRRRETPQPHGARHTAVVPDVSAKVDLLRAFLRRTDDAGRAIGSARCGIYCFFDYDEEPIYVGQTVEGVQVRIGRHMTNQRTDAVAMHVLDPVEVAFVEIWPFWQLENASPIQRRATIDAGEYTVYRRVIAASPIGRILNEKVPAETELIELPQSYRARLVPDATWDRLSHPDERIARRAQTIADLARVVRERDVSVGLRRTLVTQAQRLLRLSDERYREVRGTTPTDELVQETVRQDDGPD